MSIRTNRREFCRRLAIGGAALFTAPRPLWSASTANDRSHTAAGPYKIAVCDWMILKRQKLGAFSLASEIGADGVQLDMGGLGQRETFDNKLADPAVARQFMEEAGKNQMEISSIAMSGFYAQSFAERPTVGRMIDDCMETMRQMKVKVAYLPLGVHADLVKRPDIRPAVVERLKEAGKKAEKGGCCIAVETSLSASEELAFLEEIDSPHIKISFNFANAVKNDRDIATELSTLGREHLAQIHASDTDGVWLENNPKIDMPRIKETLDAMDWSGWLIVERSRDVEDVHNVRKNYGANVAYLKSVFQSER